MRSEPATITAVDPADDALRAAAAERIAVGVWLAFNDAADEHVLEVVVVPTPSGPRVDEVRL